MTDFSKKLKELRIEKELTQAQLAKLLLVDQRSISNWEKGTREPDFSTLVMIAEFFHVTTDYLLGLEND